MKKNEARLYIIGAGFAGQMIAQDLARKKIFGSVAAFLDDDKNLIGTKIDGIPVFGPIQSAAEILRADSQDEAIIAIPSAPTEKIKDIYDVLKNTFAKIRILPSVSQIIGGKARFVQTRKIDPLDILGRTPVKISLKESLEYLRKKRVFITGAGGSIGSEISRQLLSAGAERLYLFGHGENSIVQIYRELLVFQNEGVGEKTCVVPIIGDMKDKEYMKYILRQTKADVIFHCAAYKHVPMTEENPVAAIENNVFGTENLLLASLETKVKKFVLISTDKAVDPCSVYGASKFLCEKLVLRASEKAFEGQDFMFVRFGNVLGSRGSILPLFMDQINAGGPVTVTDPGMRRYFMTIPEACSLVLRSGGVGSNGKAYLLDMGEPVKITDLAEQIIRFSGLEPYKDIGIKITGKRKGERLEERLWLKEEEPEKTEYEKIFELKNISFSDKKLCSLLEELKSICFYREKDEAASIDAKSDSEQKEARFRNKELLISILRKNFSSLDKAYEESSEEKKAAFL